MASIYKPKLSPYWYARFRSPYGGTQCRVSTKIEAEESSRAEAKKLAAQLEQAAQIVREPDEYTTKAVRASHGLLQSFGLNAKPTKAEQKKRPEKQRTTILRAACAHHSAKHEAENDLESYKAHMKGLRLFLEVTGVKYLDELHYEHFTAYVAHLKANDYKWATRKHKYYYPLHAARMAPLYGLPDPVGQLRFDRREAREPAKSVGREHFPEILKTALESADCRPLFGVLLCGVMGLRPYDLYRLKRENIDLDRQVLSITKGKTAWAVRDLPIPLVVCKWLSGRLPSNPDHWLIASHHRGHKGKALDAKKYPMVLQRVVGKEVTTKRLQKHFSTSARDPWRLPPHHAERMQGHVPRDLTGTTYAEPPTVEDLRSTVGIINKWLVDVTKSDFFVINS